MEHGKPFDRPVLDHIVVYRRLRMQEGCNRGRAAKALRAPAAEPDFA
jgi:hypothetical protein